MSFLAGLLIFIALVVIPILTVIVLINPFKIRYPLKGEVTRGKWLGLLLGSMLALLFVGGVFGMIANDQEQLTPQQQAQEMIKQSGIEDDGSVKASVTKDGAIVIEPIQQDQTKPDIPESVKQHAIDEEGRAWVRENFVMWQEWKPEEWRERFGEWEEIPVTDRNPEVVKNYYFPSIDMTIAVNVRKNEAIRWDYGKGGL